MTLVQHTDACACAQMQTHYLLQIQLSSRKTHMKRDGNGENTEITMQRRIQESEVDKRNDDLTSMFEKREVHGERRDVFWPSGALPPSFHVQSRLPCDFQWGENELTDAVR